MKKLFYIAAICLIALTGCRKRGEEKSNLFYRNLFAYNNMQNYYLWIDDIADAMQGWKQEEPDPVAKVESIRYSADKWTKLLSDASTFESSVSGDGKTFGADFALIGESETGTIHLIVRYVYENSPAAKAGLVRGDHFSQINGQTMTMSNYQELISSALANPSTVDLSDGERTVHLTAAQMYSNPVQTVRTFTAGGKTIGYLHYTGFTLKSAKDLENAFRTFKSAGVTDLVLDLRYNGGGYTVVATALASMIAPWNYVNTGRVFTQDIYNSSLISKMEDKDIYAHLAATHDIQEVGTVDAGSVNLNLPALWVITSEATASASEALICGLNPYMDVTLVGKKTLGKFCGGYLIKADDWYDAIGQKNADKIDCDAGKRATENWGIYVIATRYSDCNGKTLSMPNGIPAKYDATDNPLDGYQLGDPQESMLASTLSRMGVSADKTPASVRPRSLQGSFTSLERPEALIPANSGLYILNK